MMKAILILGLVAAASAHNPDALPEGPTQNAHASEASATPTTFPFDNEGYVPADLPEAVPAHTFDDSDTGGYHYHYIWHLDLNNVEMPFCAMMSGCNQFPLVSNFGAPPFLPAEMWNCSANGLYFDADDFTGEVTGVTVEKLCEIGSCCQNFMGESKFGDDQMDWHNWLNNLASAGMCAEVGVEELYCDMVNGHYQGNCLSRWVSGTERTNVLPCFDMHILYFLSCPVYQNVPVYFGWDSEPDLYLDMCDLEQQTIIMNSVEENDHVCLPNSHFRPETAAATTTTTTTTTASGTTSSGSSAAGSASSSSASDSDSSAALLSWTVLFAAIAFQL